VLLAISACGSSGDAVVEKLAEFPAVDTINETADGTTSRRNSLLVFAPEDGTSVDFSEMAYFAADVLILQNESPTVGYNKPSTAQATYDGLVGVTFDQTNETMIGRATLTADFSSGTVDGNTSGYTVFQEQYNIDTDAITYVDVAKMTGSIPFTNGTMSTQSFDIGLGSIGRTNVETFTADLNGTLASTNAAYDGMQVAIDVEAGFGTIEGQNVVIGEATGTFTTPSFSNGSLSGGIVASERK